MAPDVKQDGAADSRWRLGPCRSTFVALGAGHTCRCGWREGHAHPDHWCGDGCGCTWRDSEAIR